MGNIEIRVSFPMRRNNAECSGAPFLVGNCDRINLIILRTEDSISLTLSKANKRLRPLTNPARLSLPSVRDMQEAVTEVTNPAARTHVSQQIKRAMVVLREETNSVCCICDTEICYPAERHKVTAREAPVRSVELPVCDFLHNFCCQSKLRSRKHDVFKPIDMDDFSQMA